MTRLQIAVALYADIRGSNRGGKSVDIAECFDLAEEFIAEEKSRQDYDLHLDREKNEAPNDDGVPF